MKKLLLGFTIGIGLLPIAAQAQLFRPGQLVLAQGDTLRGEIEDNSWEDAPPQVRFRTADGAAITSYAPVAVRAFWLQGGRYFRYETLPLDRTARTQLSQLPYTPLHHPRPVSFLAEVLVAGPASLLHTMVEGVHHYFVRRETQPYLELSERHYLREQNGRTVIADANNYRAELQNYLGDCPAARQQVDVAPFTAAGLAAVVQAYNQQCAATPGPSTTYLEVTTRATRRTSVNIGLVAGGRYSSCQLHAQAPGTGNSLDGANLDSIVHPLSGLYADILLPGRSVALHLTGLLVPIGREATVASSTNGVTAHVSNKLTIIEFRIGSRFFWAATPRGRRFFVGTGITLPYATGNDYYPILIYYDATQQALSGSSAPDAYPHSKFLPYLEAGVRQGRVTLALDGRTQWENVQYLYSGSTPDAYTYRNWYVSATLGLALLKGQ